MKPSAYIPSVDAILSSLPDRYSLPHSMVVRLIREVIQKYREQVSNGIHGDLDRQGAIELVRSRVIDRLEAKERSLLKRVVNGSGVIIHTNLGRAPLAQRIAERLVEILAGYINLEYDLDSGERGTRGGIIHELLSEICASEDALVVNNNAAAVLLALDTLANGREIIISRGELVEIGDSFRIPEVLKKSGAKMIEVGTTNKTRLSDYENAITSETAAILKVHQSNFNIQGFTEQVSLDQLSQLAKSLKLMLIYDLGSGRLAETITKVDQREMTPALAHKQGADIVTFSGDKLLGGCQAGIISGGKEQISMMKRNQLYRALRVDKYTYFALQELILAYLTSKDSDIPVISMIRASLDELMKKGDRLLKVLEPLKDQYDIHIEPGKSAIGGGSSPLELDSYRLVIIHKKMTATELSRSLRTFQYPIVGFISDDKFMLDVRTLLPGDEQLILNALVALSESSE